MSDTGWIRGGTVVNDNTVGGDNSWGNPSSAIDGDLETNYSSNLIPGTEYTQYLKVTNFGFNIPFNSIIDKISVQIYLSRYGAVGAEDGYIRLVKDGSLSGDNVADAVIWFHSGYKEWSGDDYSLWGNTFDLEDINNSNFGVAISGYANGSSEDTLGFKISDVQIKVYYTKGETPIIGSKYPLPAFKIIS